MQIITTYAGATLAIMDDAEQAAWEAANPAAGQFIFNKESKKLTYLDENGDVQNMFFSGDTPTPYTKGIKGYTGSTYINTDFINGTPKMFFVDGSPRFLVTSSPDPGTDYTFDESTGEIDIGTPFDSNNIIFEYTSLTPPSV